MATRTHAPKPVSSSKNRSVPIRIELQGIEPLIWRRIAVPAEWSLGQLHEYVQWVMGWQDTHAHEFRLGRVTVADARWIAEMSIGRDASDYVNERDMSVAQALEQAGDARELEYVYDMGDDWVHRVVFEPSAARVGYVSSMLPLCVAGENACPPEDCGGPPGYADFLEAIGNSKSNRRTELLDWVGGVFDPKGFDLNRINRDWHGRMA